MLDKYPIIEILRKNKAKIGKSCDIESGLTFHNCKDFRNLVIGNDVHIGKNCFFDLRDTIEIGDNVVISMQSTIITHLDLSKSDLSRLFPSTHAPVRIENNAYIGANSTILQGNTLGKNSFVAAGALVNKDVAANSLVAGIPAKTIKRFPSH